MNPTSPHENMFGDSPLSVAGKQIEFARRYMLGLVDAVDPALWGKVPDGGPAPIIWQVGHLAMAEYGLCLFQQRGRAMIDRNLLPRNFVKHFGKGSTPGDRVEDYPTPQEMLAILTRVHEQAMSEMSDYSDEHLGEPLDPPYAVYANKLGALLFCSHHEMLHAGQIGLTRRLLGLDPVR